jgi:hypothetical protein
MSLSVKDLQDMEAFFLTERRLNQVLKEQREEYEEALDAKLLPITSDICEIKESLSKGSFRFQTTEEEIDDIKKTCEARHANPVPPSPAYTVNPKPSILDSKLARLGVGTGGGGAVVILIYLLLHLLGIDVPMP